MMQIFNNQGVHELTYFSVLTIRSPGWRSRQYQDHVDEWPEHRLQKLAAAEQVSQVIILFYCITFNFYNIGT